MRSLAEEESSRKERTGKDTEGRTLRVGRQEPENHNDATLPREQMTVVEDPEDRETRVRKLTVDYVYNEFLTD